MRAALFSTHRFEIPVFEALNRCLPAPHEITFFDSRLSAQTAAIAHGFPCVCPFVNDTVNRAVVEELSERGLRLLALRSAGYNHVDLAACKERGVTVVRVPAYSPNAVAEHALALILTLNRKTHRAYVRVRELNFSLEGLVGFDLNGKVAGIIGTGKIGSILAKILSGIGCKVKAFDPFPNQQLIAELGVEYTSLNELYEESDIISLQIPLTKDTHHIIISNAIGHMKRGVMLINTGRGALIDTRALIEGLKTGIVGGAGLDVYEEEEGVFFRDLSGEVLADDVLARLLTFPNVIVTAHQAFLTKEALHNIAETTLMNISDFEVGKELKNKL